VNLGRLVSFDAGSRNTMNALFEKYVKRILDARVYDVSERTRLHKATNLSHRLNNTVLLKREDEQPIFSFKCRGAFNRIFRLTEAQSVEGVIAASAGNHAQGVALAAQKLNLNAVIVMPETTPQIKIDSVKGLGAEAILYGDDFDAACTHALKLSEQKGYPFIHPFDDPDTIAGQGTVAVELCQQHPGDIDAVFLPIGGGGLAAGVSVYMKYLRPSVRIIGVEPIDAASMHDAIVANERIALEQVGLFADGVAVKRAGEQTFEVCRECVDEILLISVDEMCAAIKDIFSDTRTLTEPAGALAVAGLKKFVAQNNIKNQTLVAINSGANVNFDRLRHVAERAEIGESREALLAVTVEEVPGSFRRFCQALGRRSVTEFNYRYSDAKRASVFVGVELAGGMSEREQLVAELSEQGYAVLDMTDNEAAKLHIRHMIGGHPNKQADPGLTSGPNRTERLFRFRFPERPGALLKFLNSMPNSWNITLFHYRNHGAAYGRVLVSIEIPDEENTELNAFLQKLGYWFREETGNQAFITFLA